MKRVITDSVHQEGVDMLLDLFTVGEKEEVEEEQRLYEQYEADLKKYRDAKAQLNTTRYLLWNKVMPEDERHITNKYIADIAKTINEHYHITVSNININMDPTVKSWTIESFSINQSIFIQRTHYESYTLTHEGVSYQGWISIERKNASKLEEQLFTRDVQRAICKLFSGFDRFIAVKQCNLREIADIRLKKRRNSRSVSAAENQKME